jgi:hypothetical protein
MNCPRCGVELYEEWVGEGLDEHRVLRESDPSHPEHTDARCAEVSAALVEKYEIAIETMRTTYAMNAHAREWADYIEKFTQHKGEEWRHCEACSAVRTQFIQWLEEQWGVSSTERLTSDEFKSKIKVTLDWSVTVAKEHDALTRRVAELEEALEKLDVLSQVSTPLYDSDKLERIRSLIARILAASQAPRKERT